MNWPRDGPSRARSLFSLARHETRPRAFISSVSVRGCRVTPTIKRFVEAPRASRWSPVAVRATLYGHRTRNYLYAFFTGPDARRGNVAHVGRLPGALLLRSPTLVNPTRPFSSLPPPLADPFCWRTRGNVGSRNVPQPGPVALLLPRYHQGRLRCADPVTTSRGRRRAHLRARTAVCYVLRVAPADAGLSFALKPPFTV